jgi:hypothetical protein
MLGIGSSLPTTQSARMFTVLPSLSFFLAPLWIVSEEICNAWQEFTSTIFTAGETVK